MMANITDLMASRYGFFLLFLGALVTSCGDGKKTTQELARAEPVTAADSQSRSYNISGNLALASLSLTSSHFNLLGSAVVLKATYAKASEDSGSIGSDGFYNITVKSLPFALTVFVDDSPTCSFIFNVGSKKSGSIKPSADLDFGKTTCLDGQAIVEERYLTGKLDQRFIEQVGNGEIADEIKSKLLDPLGLTATILASNGAPQSGSIAFAIDGHDGKSALTESDTTEPASVLGIDPKICSASGYDVPDYFFTDYQNSLDENKKPTTASPTIFIEESAIGLYRLRVESKGRDGQPEVDIFEEIKLGGSNEEFTLVGSSPTYARELKAKAVVDTLRDILYTFNTGNEAHSLPSWSDYSCDPLQIANTIITNLGRRPYSNISVFPVAGQVTKPQLTIKGAAKPDCAATSTPSNGLITLKNLCYEADAKTPKAQTLMAAQMLCQVEKEAGKVNYWKTLLKDANGDPVKACAKETNNKVGTKYRLNYLTITEEKCENYRQTAISFPPSDGTTLSYSWRSVERNMNLDCSELRVAKIFLKECQFNFDVTVEPNFVQPTRAEVPTPAQWWDGKYTLAGAAVAIDAALAKSSRTGTLSPLAAVREQIEVCSGKFANSLTELDNRRAKLNGMAKAINLIVSAKNDNGQLKYLRDNASGFFKQGDFYFTSNQIAKLQAVLKKSQSALDAWAESLKQIQDTYSLLQQAVLKGEVESASKCVAAEIASQENFSSFYSRFDKAYNGISGDKINRGLMNWQNIAFNHFQCMDMDQNLLRIRNFGISAPLIGIVDSNIPESAPPTIRGLLVDDPTSCDFTDTRGRCITYKTCQIPAGAETYVPFSTLVETGMIAEGCEAVVQKVAMVGRMNAHEFKVNNIEVPLDELVASVLLMTSLPKKSCELTLKIPAMDSDGCFIYQDEDGVSWGKLSNDGRATAKASNFTLSYQDKIVPMLKLANRQVLQLLLIPNSAVPTLKQQQVNKINGAEAGSSASDQLNKSIPNAQ